MELFLVSAAVILRIFSNSLGNVYQKKLTNKGCNPYVINFVTYLLLSLSCLPLMFQTGLFKSDLHFWLYALIIGLLGSLGNGFLVKALEFGDLSVLGPINSYKAVVGLILGMILLKEMPNLYGMAGMVLIILGSFFVLDSPKNRFSLKVFKRKDLQYRFLALIFCAAEAVYLKKIILISDITSAFVIWCLFGFLFSSVILFFKKIDYKFELSVMKTRAALFFVNISVFAGVMQFTTNYVFSHMNVSYALALFQLSSIVSIILGYKIFKEENIMKKLIGAVIMILGAMLIILCK